MIPAKAQIEKVLKQIPNDCSIEDVQHHLYIVLTIERRLAMADRGKAVSRTEASKRLRKWLTKEA